MGEAVSKDRNGFEYLIEEIDIEITHDDLIDLSQGKTVWAFAGDDTRISIRVQGSGS